MKPQTLSPEKRAFMNARIHDWISLDRQWKREQRLAFAKTQHQNATTQDDKYFWKEIVKANTL